MQHKLSINSLYSFIYLFKYLKSLMCLKKIKSWKGKNIDWSYFKLVITNFKWVLVLPSYPTFYSMHSRSLYHTPHLSLQTFKISCPSPISADDFASCFTEKTNQLEENFHRPSPPKISCLHPFSCALPSFLLYWENCLPPI